MRQILIGLQILCAFTALAGTRPNVILILTDDQGYGDIRSHGNELIDTPNLDRLAADGARFEQFFVSPVCAPTRASVLTGRYHMRTGVLNVSNNLEIMRPEEITIAELFKANGYATGLFGKWHNGEHYPYNPNGQGFDEFVGFCAGHVGNYFDPVLEHNAGTIETKGFITDVLTDKALDWIEENQNTPFFCYIPYNAPHTPYQVPDALFEKYRAHGLNVKNATVYGMVENVDDNIGRIFQTLETLSLSENTIVLFLTDNGPNTPDRYNAGMKGHKTHVDEGGIRVPLFVKWPGNIEPGTVVNEIAAHIDLLPTLMELCNLPIPSHLQLDGISLEPVLIKNELLPTDRIICTHKYFGGKLQPRNGTARSNQYRYVLKKGEESLYDLENDPGQKKNIRKQHPELFERMRGAYDRWYKEVTDGWELLSVIPCGYSEFPITHLHAVQSKISGQLKFHGKGYHHDWIINWINPKDTIRWDIDIVASGTYRVAVKYTCPETDVGSGICLSVGGKELKTTVNKAFDPAPYPDFDRAPRSGEREKPWSTLEIGTVDLNKGETCLILSVTEMPGAQVMEVREVILERIKESK